jgi:hypothetical protein
MPARPCAPARAFVSGSVAGRGWLCPGSNGGQKRPSIRECAGRVDDDHGCAPGAVRLAWAGRGGLAGGNPARAECLLPARGGRDVPIGFRTRRSSTDCVRLGPAVKRDGHPRVVFHIQQKIHELGGIASTRQLDEAGYWQSMIQLWSMYGRIINVCRGWWATPYTLPQLIVARRAGGRLACVSALAYHGRVEWSEPLHILLGASRKRPRDHTLVLHWSRRKLAGDQHAVSVEVALDHARRCRALKAAGNLVG